MLRTDYIGKVISDIEVIQKATGDNPKYRKNLYVKAKCFCGNTFETRLKRLEEGNTKSCGCTLTGRSKKHWYNTWGNIMSRCYKEYATGYSNYGARGISVCSEWHDPEVFGVWAESEGLEVGMQIDRIDNDKGYSPSNCRVVTREQNQFNRRGRGGSSKYKGVTFYKKSCEWQAEISFRGKRSYLGRFKKQEEAAKAYDEKAKELFGEYAYANFS